jgi:hypothetical protein
MDCNAINVPTLYPGEMLTFQFTITSNGTKFNEFYWTSTNPANNLITYSPTGYIFGPGKYISVYMSIG